MKERLKSVLNYRSYPQNNSGYPLFRTTLYSPANAVNTDIDPATVRNAAVLHRFIKLRRHRGP